MSFKQINQIISKVSAQVKTTGWIDTFNYIEKFGLKEVKLTPQETEVLNKYLNKKFAYPEPEVCKGCILNTSYNCEDICPNQPIENINAKVLQRLVEHYCHGTDDNTRLDFQNTVMYALNAPDQEAPIVAKFWKQFQI